MIQKLTHDMFNEDIYKWTQGIKEGKVYSIKNIKMNKEKFIGHISYLIACGEPILFTNDMNGIIKTSSFQETLSEWDTAKEMNARTTQLRERRETYFSKRVKYLSEKRKSLKSNEINSNK